MDVDPTRPLGKGSHSRALSSQGAGQGDDQKELAWAFLGLMLWSAVVLVGIFGVGQILGHSVLHWW
jgi:hypothetical protein